MNRPVSPTLEIRAGKDGNTIQLVALTSAAAIPWASLAQAAWLSCSGRRRSLNDDFTLD